MSIRIISSGGFVPFQADGFINNNWGFYYRDRHGWASLKVSPILRHNADGTPALTFTDGMCDQFPGLYTAYWSASTATEEFQGRETFPHVMPELLGNLEPYPLRFVFSGRKLDPNYVTDGDACHVGDWEVVDEPSEYVSWGHTAGDAWENLKGNLTLDEDEPEEIFAAVQISQTPVEVPEEKDYTSLSLPPIVTTEEILAALEVKGWSEDEEKVHYAAMREYFRSRNSPLPFLREGSLLQVGDESEDSPVTMLENPGP